MAGTLKVAGLGQVRVGIHDFDKSEATNDPALCETGSNRAKKPNEPKKPPQPRLLAGEITQFTLREQGGSWWVAVIWVNRPVDSLLRCPKKTVQFDFDDPTDRVTNPGRIGVAALDASVKHGAVATSDGQTTSVVFPAAVRAKSDAAHVKGAKYQRIQARLQDARMAQAGVVRGPDGKLPKGCGPQIRAVPKSNNLLKVEAKVAKLSLHELFRRRDAIHKFTTELVRQHHTIVVETLILVEMAKSLNRGFRRRMHEACMGEIISQLIYKCAWHNRTLLFVGKWFPSSKRCSNAACHKKNIQLTLSDRSWVCPSCHMEHERDANAAFNLWQEGWRLLEELSSQGSTGMLAAGSVVRGSQAWLDRVNRSASFPAVAQARD